MLLCIYFLCFGFVLAFLLALLKTYYVVARRYLLKRRVSTLQTLSYPTSGTLPFRLVDYLGRYLSSVQKSGGYCLVIVLPPESVLI